MSTKPSPEQSSSHELTPQEASDIIETLEPIRKRSRLGAAALALVVGLGSILPIDIAIGKEAIENSRPIIHPIAPATDTGSTDNIIDYLDGFARQDSSWQARNMVDALQSGTGSAINALEYSEKGINIDNIARSIAENLKENGATSVTLYGYSIGGDVALLVAGALIHKFDIAVTTIYLDHTPSGIKDINSDQRKTAESVINIVDLFDNFGIELKDSSIARGIVNANIPDDTTYIDQVSSSLIIDQFNLGASINIKAALSNLKSREFPSPVVVYVSSSNPDSDQVIDLVQSEMTFEEATKAANIPFIPLYVKGSVHGRPDLDKSYNTVIPEAKPAIDALAKRTAELHELHTSPGIRTNILFR